ncbi:MAG: hypothetical protein HYS98_06035 [Deltaproteobacteria bacterium]|nr:hypothetical protein [Deltaproteobacteria bacterium]
MAGIDVNFAQQFQNLPVQGSNGYSGNFGEYYSMQYQRQGNYNYQYSNPGDYQIMYNGGWQPMDQFYNQFNRSNPYSNTFYLNLDWQENPYSGRTSFGGNMGFY